MRSNGRIYWLWCCFTVFLAGCGHTLTGATAPALLTFSTPTMKPTATFRLLRTPTLRPSGTALAMVVTPLPLIVEPPSCYETAVGSLWCFGLVRNTLGMPVEQVMIRIYLVTVDGQALDEAMASTAHEVILVDGLSPYGVLFNNTPNQFAGAVAVLDNGVAMSSEMQHHIAALTVTNVKYNNRDGVYDITASLTNSDKQPLYDINVVVTLFTANGQVTGFRQQRLSQPLVGGESSLFNTDAIAQGQPVQEVAISAQGWR